MAQYSLHLLLLTPSHSLLPLPPSYFFPFPPYSLPSYLSVKQLNLRISPPHQTSQHLPSRVDIKLHLLSRGYIPSRIQILGRDGFERAAAQVESEAYEGVELVLG